jgi:hypothetical protein
MRTIPELLQEHVALEVECIDRVYLNGYVPILQRSGGLVHFLCHHRGEIIPSPALLGRISQGFVAELKAYAEAHHIPLVHFEKGQRKDDVAAWYRRRFAADEGVVFIGVAQERMHGFKAHKDQKGKAVRFQFSRQSIYVNHYYIYVQDAEFGPGFIKIAAYAPYPVKVCLNGHEWVKQQLRREGIAFTALDNGLRQCADPQRLQELCHALGAEQVQAFFDKWVERLPWPLTPEDRQAGYQHRLSIWQMEVSLTHVFARPLRGGEFFEPVMRENLDLGRPDRMQLIFDRQMRRNTPSRFLTRVIQVGVQPSIHITYKHSGVKQYFKENRALRTETTINDPHDFDVAKDLSNWMYLRQLAAAVNRRLLENERISQDCLLSATSFARVSEPTVAPTGQRASGLRFGQPRVMALFAALARFAPALNGFHHADLRPLVQALLPESAQDYTASQMTYDLRRLRLKGLIARIQGTHRYIITSYGRRIAVLMAKLHSRIFNVASLAFSPSMDPAHPLAKAFKQIDQELDRIVANAQLSPSQT